MILGGGVKTVEAALLLCRRDRFTGAEDICTEDLHICTMLFRDMTSFFITAITFVCTSFLQPARVFVIVQRRIRGKYDLPASLRSMCTSPYVRTSTMSCPAPHIERIKRRNGMHFYKNPPLSREIMAFLLLVVVIVRNRFRAVLCMLTSINW